MRTVMPSIVLPTIWNKGATPFPATKFRDAPSNRCANRRLANVHQRIRPRSRPSLGQAARDCASTSEVLKATVVGEFFACLRRLSTLPSALCSCL
jgi:hypothetical protein